MQIPMEPIIVAPIPLPPSTTDPDNFDQRANEFLSALPDFQIDLNLVAENVYDNAMIVYDAALEIDSKTVIATQAATTATTAATNAGAALAQMQELYLGAKTTAPTLDNTGRPLQVGAWYTNITTGVWYWWSGTAWKIGVGDMTVVNWTTQVTGKPTTIAELGITDLNYAGLPGRNGNVSDLNDFTLTPDVYRVPVTATGSRPEGETQAAILEVKAVGSNVTQQRYISPATTSEYIRYSWNQAWSYWRRNSTQTDAAVSTTGEINLWRGNYFYITADGPVTISVSDAINAAFYEGTMLQVSFVVELQFNSGSVAFLGAFKWSDGVTPVFTAGRKYLLAFQREKSGPGYWLVRVAGVYL